jgi:hypothetical protein
VILEEVRRALVDYGRGLDTELSLLDELARWARAQNQAAHAGDSPALSSASTGRQAAMDALLDVEERVRPVRAMIIAHLREARVQEGFPALASKHRQGERLLAAIAECDRETLDILQDAERARRLSVHAIEAGEATLAAYRKVIAPPLGSAELLSRRG